MADNSNIIFGRPAGGSTAGYDLLGECSVDEQKSSATCSDGSAESSFTLSCNDADGKCSVEDGKFEINSADGKTYLLLTGLTTKSLITVTNSSPDADKQLKEYLLYQPERDGAESVKKFGPANDAFAQYSAWYQLHSQDIPGNAILLGVRTESGVSDLPITLPTLDSAKKLTTAPEAFVLQSAGATEIFYSLKEFETYLKDKNGAFNATLIHFQNGEGKSVPPLRITVKNYGELKVYQEWTAVTHKKIINDRTVTTEVLGGNSLKWRVNVGPRVLVRPPKTTLWPDNGQYRAARVAAEVDPIYREDANEALTTDTGTRDPNCALGTAFCGVKADIMFYAGQNIFGFGPAFAYDTNGALDRFAPGLQLELDLFEIFTDNPPFSIVPFARGNALIQRGESREAQLHSNLVDAKGVGWEWELGILLPISIKSAIGYTGELHATPFVSFQQSWPGLPERDDLNDDRMHALTFGIEFGFGQLIMPEKEEHTFSSNSVNNDDHVKVTKGEQDIKETKWKEYSNVEFSAPADLNITLAHTDTADSDTIKGKMDDMGGLGTPSPATLPNGLHYENDYGEKTFALGNSYIIWQVLSPSGQVLGSASQKIHVEQTAAPIVEQPPEQKVIEEPAPQSGKLIAPDSKEIVALQPTYDESTMIDLAGLYIGNTWPTFEGDVNAESIVLEPPTGFPGGYPLGTYKVKWTAKMIDGSPVEPVESTITIVDRNAPIISASNIQRFTKTANVQIDLNSLTGDEAITAEDAVEGTVAFTYEPNTRDFPLGETKVMITATDTSGNASTKEITVTVIEEPPAVTTVAAGPLSTKMEFNDKIPERPEIARDGDSLFASNSSHLKILKSDIDKNDKTNSEVRNLAASLISQIKAGVELGFTKFEVSGGEIHAYADPVGTTGFNNNISKGRAGELDGRAFTDRAFCTTKGKSNRTIHEKVTSEPHCASIKKENGVEYQELKRQGILQPLIDELNTQIAMWKASGDAPKDLDITISADKIRSNGHGEQFPKAYELGDVPMKNGRKDKNISAKTEKQLIENFIEKFNSGQIPSEQFKTLDIGSDDKEPTKNRFIAKLDDGSLSLTVPTKNKKVKITGNDPATYATSKNGGFGLIEHNGKYYLVDLKQSRRVEVSLKMEVTDLKVDPAQMKTLDALGMATITIEKDDRKAELHQLILTGTLGDNPAIEDADKVNIASAISEFGKAEDGKELIIFVSLKQDQTERKAIANWIGLLANQYSAGSVKTRVFFVDDPDAKENSVIIAEGYYTGSITAEKMKEPGSLGLKISETVAAMVKGLDVSTVQDPSSILDTSPHGAIQNKTDPMEYVRYFIPRDEDLSDTIQFLSIHTTKDGGIIIILASKDERIDKAKVEEEIRLIAHRFGMVPRVVFMVDSRIKGNATVIIDDDKTLTDNPINDPKDPGFILRSEILKLLK